MEKIGEIFTCDGKTYQVVKGDGCCILHDHCFSIKESLGPCVDVSRTDKTSIIFKEKNNLYNKITALENQDKLSKFTVGECYLDTRQDNLIKENTSDEFIERKINDILGIKEK